jgi:hypothetical protein
MSGEHRTSRLPARWLTLEAHDSPSRNLADAVGDDVARPCKGPTREKVHLQEWTPQEQGRRSNSQTRSSLHPVRASSLRIKHMGELNSPSGFEPSNINQILSSK